MLCETYKTSLHVCWFSLSHDRVNHLETCWMSVSPDTTIDGPAETQAAPLTISCHHFLGCQNNGIAPLSICMHSLISSWFLYFVCVLLSTPVQLTEHVGIYRRQVTPKLFPALWDLSEKSLTSVLKYQIQCQLGRMLLWLALCCSNDRGNVIQLNRFRSKYYNWGKVM